MTWSLRQSSVDTVLGRRSSSPPHSPRWPAAAQLPRPGAPSALNFITPIPFDIEVPVDGAHPWVSADAPPGDDAPDSEHLASYFGDGGCPTGLGYDVEFLLSAVQVELFLGADNLVRRRTSQVQVGGREPAAEIDFSRDNQDVSLGAPDSAQVAQR